ncbi:hypothetical protein, partial [Klebsiella pneumoniae]|uniref:hypothetical protein n=1 Tax=Klebsiella pneumoniae TaxID=573 RepID=UPI00191A52DE
MTPIRTAIVHLTALLACGAAGAQTPPGAATDATASTASPTAAGPVLRPGTNAHFIPFASPPGDQSLPMANAPRLAFEVRMPADGPVNAPARTFTVTMDTGSTGVVISAVDLPGYSRAGEARDTHPGWEFLSSSKRLWIGHWV